MSSSIRGFVRAFHSTGKDMSGKVEPGRGYGKGAGVDDGQHGTGVESLRDGCKGPGMDNPVPTCAVQA